MAVWPVTLSDGSEAEGLIYIMKRIRQSPPTDTYYYGIRDAYRDLGLDAQIPTVLQPALQRSLDRQ